MEIYCLKCREKTHAKHTEEKVLPNGRHQIAGKCGKCDGKVSKLVSAKKK